MKRVRSFLCFAVIIVLFLSSSRLQAQEQSALDKIFPVRGLFVDAPNRSRIDGFCKFIDEELGPNHINTLILAVNYNYRFTSRPEMANPNAIGKEDVAKIVETCKKHDINVFPLINLLGHQSWAASAGKLLSVYPEFSETPNIKAQKVEWPNPDGYYCLSYCPLHPDVHDVVFPLVDEVVKDFGAKDFHAGMDEVFYIGHETCPRCAGKDRAKLFSDEMQKIRDHLAQSETRLWIWGDRLIDGRKTGVGEWEGSTNGTHPAVTTIPRDIVICDWHYNRAETTAALFAAQELDVVSCFWNRPQVAADTLEAVQLFRKVSARKMTSHYRGVMQTVWSGNDRLLRDYYNADLDENGGTEAASFKRMLKLLNSLHDQQ
jgi:N-acetyl-beta-hexosaminidase